MSTITGAFLYHKAEEGSAVEHAIEEHRHMLNRFSVGLTHRLDNWRSWTISGGTYLQQGDLDKIVALMTTDVLETLDLHVLDTMVYPRPEEYFLRIEDGKLTRYNQVPLFMCAEDQEQLKRLAVRVQSARANGTSPSLQSYGEWVNMLPAKAVGLILKGLLGNTHWSR